MALAGAGLAFWLPATALAGRRGSSHGPFHHRRLARIARKPCPGGTLNPANAPLPRLRGAVLCLINRERARAGIAPLRLNGALTEAAQRYAERMVAQRFFADEPPGGETVAARLRAAGYIPGGDVGYLIGENLAWGTYTAATPAETVAAWLASPPHRANILDPRFRETGVGVAAGVPVAAAAGELGATYAQEFGRILR